MAIINKCGINENQENEIRSFCEENQVLLAGELPYDTVFTKAQLAGLSAVEYEPEGAGKMFEKIWKMIEINL